MSSEIEKNIQSQKTWFSSSPLLISSNSFFTVNSRRLELDGTSPPPFVDKSTINQPRSRMNETYTDSAAIRLINGPIASYHENLSEYTILFARYTVYFEMNIISSHIIKLL